MKKIIAVILCLAVIAGFSVLPAQAKMVIFDYHLPFEVWQGEGDVSVLIKGYGTNEDIINEAVAFDNFEKLSYNGTEIGSDFYTLENTDGFVKLTLREEYIKTLGHGKYYFDAVYKDVDMSLLLYVITEKATVENVVFDSGVDDGVSSAGFTITGIDHPLGAELVEYISLNGEKLPEDCYSVSFLGNDGIVTLTGDYMRTLPDGIYEFDIEFLSVTGIRLRINILRNSWEDFTENMLPNRLRALGCQRTGDLDADGRITAADARLCLRYSAQLDELTTAQIGAADVNNNAGITSSDARKILRIAAGLDVAKSRQLRSFTDWGFVFGALKTAGSGRYFWHCEVNAEGMSFTEETVESADGKDGAPAEQFFVFSTEKAGDYVLTFTLADAGKTEIIETFTVNVTVSQPE